MESEFKIVKLRDNSEVNNVASDWFHGKWGVSAETYLQSIEECQQTTADGCFMFRNLSKERFTNRIPLPIGL